MKYIEYFFLLLIITLNLFFSCKKDENNENKDVFGEATYTDSFSPKEWENPLGRIKIEAFDKDIGRFISIDTIDLRLRKILDVIANFVLYINNDDVDKINKILTPSAYNSFALRFSKVSVNKKYTIRVSYPEDPERKQMWLDFKIIFPSYSIVSKVELERFNDVYKISDFEDSFFDDLEKMFSR